MICRINLNFREAWEDVSRGSFIPPGGSEVKASACNVGDLGLIPGSGRFPGAQGASLHPELPLGVLKVTSCSSAGGVQSQ